MTEDIWNLPQRGLWDRDAAENYDASGAMSSPAVLEPTVATLAELAAGGRALEFAIGTGRVGIPLREAGVEVVGIELSPDMVTQLRTRADEHTLPVAVGSMTDTHVEGEFSLVYLVSTRSRTSTRRLNRLPASAMQRHTWPPVAGS